MALITALFILGQSPQDTGEVRAEPPPVVLPPSQMRVVPTPQGYSLTWKAPPEGSPVEAYQVFRDGQPVAKLKPDQTSYLDQGTTGEHAFFVRALGPDGVYADTKQMQVAGLASFKARQDWAVFGFAGYKITWLETLSGPVEVWKNGKLLVTLPPGTPEFTDYKATKGETGYGIRDAATGKEVVPNVAGVWRAVHYRGLNLSWDVQGVDSLDLMRLQGGKAVFVARVGAHEKNFLDPDVSHTRTYSYMLVSDDGQATYLSQPIQPPYIDFAKMPVLIFDLLFGGAFFLFLILARAGRPMFIRKIAGLEELDNAVGRSTELGRPILYVPGIGTIADLQTIASLTILKHVARKAAAYETSIIMPNYDPLVLAAAREVIKEAYTEEGRPDLYNEDDIFFVSQQQFAFAAAVDGIMVREKPGANFLIGVYFAESLVISETGYSVGAIQIAGTAQTVQIPFFLATCDYTLIGEELYAASAYLSRNAMQIATLKAEDMFKALIALTVALFSLFASMSVYFTFLE